MIIVTGSFRSNDRVKDVRHNKKAGSIGAGGISDKKNTHLLAASSEFAGMIRHNHPPR
ncbi:hypothetical protein [Bacillus sp. FJAT-44742]|uniref:hypothetical protein n=1 Tax=Bacillus sp. FJAT-44742 TaxID=2014005 RepID=UPI0018E1F8DE|nr:hypothetical protein [Bacillus sp. FJAT-44742]